LSWDAAGARESMTTNVLDLGRKYHEDRPKPNRELKRPVEKKERSE